MHRSETTVEEFLLLIAHLPLKVVERNEFGGLALTTTGALQFGEWIPVFEELKRLAGKHGLKARQGIVVWTVNGFATEETL